MTSAKKIDELMADVPPVDVPTVVTLPAVTLSRLHGDKPAFDGLTVRDFFAAHALAGYLACHAGDETALPKRGEVACYAYQLADEMLQARGRTSN